MKGGNVISKSGGLNLLEKGVRGISDTGNRSLNLSSMINDSSLKRAYLTSEAHGELPTKRARVLILGEPRVGKTSLLNRLLGRTFDIHERPTHGINTRMCHVTNADSSWNESGDANADDIRECASAVTVLKDFSPTYFKNTSSYQDSNKLLLLPDKYAPKTGYALVMVKCLIMLQIFVIIAAIYMLMMFKYGFFPFVWSSIIALSLTMDFNSAYRLATPFSVFAALMEAVFRINLPLQELACKANDHIGSTSEQPIHFIPIILIVLVASSLVGVFCSCGCRTGVAVAFFLCAHPFESATPQTQYDMGDPWSSLVISVIFGVGGSFGFSSYIYCTAHDQWHKGRIVFCCCFILLILGFYLSAECHSRPYWFTCLIGYALVIGATWGSVFGRRAILKYGFEASYVTKKTLGLGFGLCLAYACGWTLKTPHTNLPSLAFYILSVSSHPMCDLYTTYKIWRAKPSFPLKVIRKQMKALVKGHPLLETKLSLWDFAGDTLYHCAHHVFMPDRALYLVVFNLKDAVSQEDEQLKKILFWLHSVCAHARHPDAVIMIVGTHKASVSVANRLRFTEKFNRQVTPSFCNRLVINPCNDKPLFLVDNSQASDGDFKQLRAEILERVQSAEYAREKYPIRYLRFYHEIQKRRQRAEVDMAENVMTLRQVEHLARQTCDVSGEDDLKNMLRFFSEAGEIIYKGDDEVLRQHVVLDPQFLVDVMRKLVQIPRAHQRCHRLASDWMHYQESAVITEGLLRHIYRDMSHLIPLLIQLLESYDLMCAVAPGINITHSQKSFLVPAMLHPYRKNPEDFWESMDNEQVFYFDFGFFDPSTVYYRLLTRCFTCLEKVSPTEAQSSSLIFADRCRFHIGTSLICKLQLERRHAQQMLLSVTMLSLDEAHDLPAKLLNCLLRIVRSIITRDYPHLTFTFGPRCPFCEAKIKPKMLDDDQKERCKEYSLEKVIHVLKMAGHDQPFPTTSSAVMLCGQRRYELKLPGCKPVDAKRHTSHLPRRVEYDRDTPINKLPPDIFQTVCRLLNNAPGRRNWKTLAGELGFDVESVTSLDSERVANPTECLLQEWAMTDGGVAVKDLVEVLARPSLMRMDIIHELCVRMTTD